MVHRWGKLFLKCPKLLVLLFYAVDLVDEGTLSQGHWQQQKVKSLGLQNPTDTDSSPTTSHLNL
jgi:hypothetical protein